MKDAAFLKKAAPKTFDLKKPGRHTELHPGCALPILTPFAGL
jgi:hypothetical protein